MKLEKITELFLQDGFHKVCDVKLCHDDHELSKKNNYSWVYNNVDLELLYLDHSSWIYFIILEKIIEKIGESGIPLGRQMQRKPKKEALGIWESESFVRTQPVAATNNRLGRLRAGNFTGGANGNDTDYRIREALYEAIRDGQNVEIWAKPCKVVKTPVTIAGVTEMTFSTTHKTEETFYLDKFKELTGDYPRLNRSRK